MTDKEARNEVWRTIPGLSAYAVSSEGRVMSCWTKSAPRVLKAGVTWKGYPYVSLIDDNGRRIARVIHRLVAMAFLAIDPTRPEVNHKDGIKTNNRLDNLEWCTRIENQRHAAQTGLAACGERHGSAKITSLMAEVIRAQYAAGHGQRQLARATGLNQRTIGRIVRGEIWCRAKAAE